MTETVEYRMDGDIDRIATKRNEENMELYAYCTSENVQIGFEGNSASVGIWVSREQAIEFIAILSRIVYSKPAESPVPTPHIVSKLGWSKEDHDKEIVCRFCASSDIEGTNLGKRD